MSLTKVDATGARAPKAPAMRRRTISLTGALLALLLALAGLITASIAQADTAPVITTHFAVGTDVVKLNWTQNSAADHYKVKFSTSSTFSGATVRATDGAKNYFNVNGLAKSKTYYFSVVGVDSSGKELTGWSAKVKQATAGYSYGTPSGLGSENITSTSVELSWQPISGAPGYRIRYYGPGGAHYAWSQVEEFTLTGLNKNTSYSISVQVQQPAIDTPDLASYQAPAVMGALSKEIKIKTSNYAISAPSNLTVSNQESTSGTVSWTAPSGVTSDLIYRVLYSKSSKMSGASTKLTVDTQIDLTGLSTNSLYYVRVDVVNGSGTQMSDRSAYQVIKTRIACGTLTGVVSGPRGSDLVIQVYDTSGELVTQGDVNSDGSYSIPVRLGSYHVKAAYLGSAGYASKWLNAANAAGVQTSGQASLVTISAAGSSVTAPAITLTKGATLSGTTLYSGNTLGSVYVTAYTGDTSAREVEGVAITANTGTFSLPGLPAGTHVVRVSKGGYKDKIFTITVSGTSIVSGWTSDPISLSK